MVYISQKALRLLRCKMKQVDVREREEVEQGSVLLGRKVKES